MGSERLKKQERRHRIHGRKHFKEGASLAEGRDNACRSTEKLYRPPKTSGTFPLADGDSNVMLPLEEGRWGQIGKVLQPGPGGEKIVLPTCNDGRGGKRLIGRSRGYPLSAARPRAVCRCPHDCLSVISSDAAKCTACRGRGMIRNEHRVWWTLH